ncbi:MAG: LTA synthase family protein [Methylococcaceae bacterium]|nr:LTA synthase family protein [Prolixibacteraceae bacterium]
MASSSVVSRKLRVSNRRFLSMSILLGAFLLLVRIYEWTVVSNLAAYPDGSWISQLYGIGYDFLLWLRICMWLIIPMIAIGYYSRLGQKIIYTAIAVVIVLSDIALIQYFAVARVPLGADLFAYSKSEMLHTLGASGQMSLSNILPSVIISIVVILAFVFIRTITLSNPVRRAFTTFIILSIFIGNLLNPYPEDYNNEFQMFVASNKLSFFNKSVKTYLDNRSALEDNMDEPVVLNQGDDAFEYVSVDYPLLHKENTPDALGPYFNTDSVRPSFVFILVESLGRAYSGENAYMGSFTPFLDSLMQKSLYWENNLSTSGRTFQVLPSMLGSLPFGERGFTDMGEKMPDHLTMVSLLKNKAGYRSSFYYGGEAPFDNMEVFMKRQGVDRVVDQKDFGPSYNRLPANGNGFSWGYGDKEIFRKYLDDFNPADSLPHIDVMLTLAMHDPFLLPNQEQYNQRVLRRMETLELTDKQKAFNKNYIRQFASMLYFDDALRGFISEFSKRKGFEHTIFVITGDHRMPEIPISTQIDRFHVPLVIYSPMLKAGKKFSSIVSHFDVTPSLLSLLQHHYGIKQPAVSAWIGHGLDTEASFRSVHAYPMMRNKNEFMDYLDGQDFLGGETVYRISENLGSDPQSQDNQLKEDLLNQFNAFKKVNLYVTRNNKLIPDSIKIR